MNGIGSCVFTLTYSRQLAVQCKYRLLLPTIYSTIEIKMEGVPLLIITLVMPNILYLYDISVTMIQNNYVI